MEQQKTIKDFSIVELKALAYDEIVKMEQAQNNIKVINQELVARSQPPVEKVEAEVIKDEKTDNN